MKIAISQLNYIIGNFEHNISKIIFQIEEAKKQNVDVIVFSELAICGYPPLDWLEMDDFMQACNNAINKIASYSVDIAVIIGAPSENTGIGKKYYNSVYFLADGEIKNIEHKCLLPNYDVFDECRYFEPNDNPSCIKYKGYTIALPICEDLWDIHNNNYKVNPMDILSKQNPDLIINIAASPFSYNHSVSRYNILSKNALKYSLPIFYVNHVGAQTDLVFDGGSMILNKYGQVIKQMAYFEEEFYVIDLKDIEKQGEEVDLLEKDRTSDSCISKVHKAIVLGIKDYFTKLGFKKAVLGMSGGIDSALVLALAVEALGAENVLPVLLPSQYSSDHSISDSIEMANMLGCKYEVVPIKDVVSSNMDSLNAISGGKISGLTEENLQARVRGVVLMSISNNFGHILLNTSNKSENAVGYGTLYGDMCGGLGVIGDLYKTQVYALAKYLNKIKPTIPLNIISKEPSAELRPDQKDSDSLPQYSLLDEILYQYIENKQNIGSLVSMGFDKEIVNKVVSLVRINEYKRMQSAPIIRLSSKAFGTGRRIPIVSKYVY